MTFSLCLAGNGIPLQYHGDVAFQGGIQGLIVDYLSLILYGIGRICDGCNHYFEIETTAGTAKLNMKRTMLVAMALVCVAMQAVAGITITCPQGGESLQLGTGYTFRWKNSVALCMETYLDRYDSKSNFVSSDNLAGFGLFAAGDYAVSFGRYDVNRVDTNSIYRLRVVGNSTNSVVCVAESGFFSFTGVPKLWATFDSTNAYWQRGQKKTVTIHWDGYNQGDAFNLSLTSWEQYISEGYGFAMTNGVFPTSSGSMSFDLDYPGPNQVIYDPTYDIVDGIHEFFLYTPASDTRYWFGAPDMVVSDIRVRMKSVSNRRFIWPSESLKIAEVIVDATFAPTNAIISELTLSFQNATNTAMNMVLSDESGQPLDRIHVGDLYNGYYFVYSFTNFSQSVLNGSVKKFYITCTPDVDAKSGAFGWSIQPNEARMNAVGNDGSALSVGMIFAWGDELILDPDNTSAKFQSVSYRSDAQELIIRAHCQTGVRYSADVSEDLVHWRTVAMTDIITSSTEFHIPSAANRTFVRIVKRTWN